MHIGLVVIGGIMWLAVYAVAVMIAAHQIETPDGEKRPAAAVFAGKAAPYLIALLFNVVIALRYLASSAMFVLWTAVAFALTWIIVAIARRQLHGKR